MSLAYANGTIWRGEPINECRYPPTIEYSPSWSNTNLAAIGLYRYTEPVPDPVPPSQSELLQYAADKRYTVETGGCAFGGSIIATDRDSQTKITGAYAKAMANGSFLIRDWKLAPGVYLDLIDANTIIAIGDTVTEHVQACFTTERMVANAILMDTCNSYAQITAWTWPSNS